MTVRKGEDWGGPAPVPDDAVVVAASPGVSKANPRVQISELKKTIGAIKLLL